MYYLVFSLILTQQLWLLLQNLQCLWQLDFVCPNRLRPKNKTFGQHSPFPWEDFGLLLRCLWKKRKNICCEICFSVDFRVKYESALILSWFWIFCSLFFGSCQFYSYPTCVCKDSDERYSNWFSKDFIQPWQKRFVPLQHKPYWNGVTLS